MLYLLWGLLNIGLFILLLVICFKATKLLREKIGLIASVIIVFGLLAFVGHLKRDIYNIGPNSNRTKIWNFVSDDSINRNATFFVKIDLEKTIVLKYYLGIKYGKDKLEQLNTPIDAYSLLSGFVSGKKWIPVSIVISKTDDNNKFQYFVSGIVEWNLIGATIYTQSKDFKGIATIE